MTDKELQAAVSRALALTAGNVTDLAAELGTSRDAIYSWSSGRRLPTPENRQRLAEVLRRRARELEELADKLG